MEQRPNYPITDCYDCANNQSCKHIASFKRTKLPIDKETVDCTAYVPQEDYEELPTLVEAIPDMDDPEYEEWFQRYVNFHGKEAIAEFMFEMMEDALIVGDEQFGEMPDAIAMNERTWEVLGHRDMFEDIPIEVDNTIMYGQFVLCYGGEEDDYE
jgi:hypothetical protein